MNLILDLQHLYRETRFLFCEDRVISIAKRILTVFWCLPHLHRIKSWFDSTENPLLIKELSQTPRIREFLFRPYVHLNWNTPERLDAIERHYKLVGSSATFLDLAPDEYIDLVELGLACGKLRVVLDRPHWMRREGEIGLSLFLDKDRIFTAMFLLSGTSANMKLIVGCVQGADFNLKEKSYKELTKELHGMRPRDFILHITKIISEELHCDEILGVSDAAHRSTLWFSRANKFSSYDEMWLEHGGIKASNGFFSLSPRIIKRTHENIEVRKRALYKRRYQFLDDIHLLLREVVVSPPPKKHHQWARIDGGSRTIPGLLATAGYLFISNSLGLSFAGCLGLYDMCVA
jgi:uncharacterized protein